MKKFDDLFVSRTYPAGEPHVELKDNISLVHGEYILAEAYDFNDLCKIRMADEILGRNEVHDPVPRKWLIPYFPFARHDRRNDNYDAQPLQLALELVEGLDVTIIDPHSDVSAILPHFTQKDFIAECDWLFLHDPIIAIPDAGATKKTFSWSGNRDYVQGLKKRDTATGKLSGFGIVDPSGLLVQNKRPVIIVDDICDGGGTFLGLGEELQKRGAGELTLVVTHGLFTKGLDDLLNVFSRIWTLNTCKLSHERLIRVPVERLVTNRRPL